MLFRRKQEITHADTTVRARAKINLTLDVTGRREDGYHTVEMVMQSIALHDTVRVTTIHGEKKPRGIVLSCSLPFLPTDERNLAYRAAELFYKETGALLVIGQTGCMQCVERTQYRRRVRRAACQTCRNRNALFDMNLAGFE